jgi:hypothetical protein
MGLPPWTVVVGSNLHLGAVCVSWPHMAFMSGGASTLLQMPFLRGQSASAGRCVFDRSLFDSLSGRSGRKRNGIRAGASVNTLRFWLLPPFLTPPPGYSRSWSSISPTQSSIERSDGGGYPQTAWNEALACDFGAVEEATVGVLGATPCSGARRRGSDRGASASREAGTEPTGRRHRRSRRRRG